MLNKKGIIGIAVFIVAALFTYAFASPNQKVEEEKDKGNNTEIVEQEKKQEETAPIVDNQVVTPFTTQVTPVTAPATITNNPVVNNDQEQIIDLTEAKNKAKDELRKYADSKGLDKEYTEELEQIVTDGNESIDNSTSEENINKALEDAKTALDNLKEKQDLEKKKEKAINELTEYHNTLFGEGNEASQKVLTDGITTINNAETIEEVNTALEDAKTALDAEKAREDLVNAKENAITELVEYYATLFDKENSEANEVLTTGKSGINNVETIEEVAEALKDAKDALDAEKARQDLVNTKNNAINELTEYHNTLFGEKGYENSKTILSNGIQTITDAKTIEDVTTALNDVKAELDNLKKAQDLANAKSKAISELIEYKNSKSFRDGFVEKANTIVSRGTFVINNSKSISDVNETLETFKAKLDDLKAVQDLEDVKNDNKIALENYKNSLGFNSEYINDANNIVSEGKTFIDNTTSISDANSALNTYKEKLNELKDEQEFQNTSKFRITFDSFNTIEYTPYDTEQCINFFGHISCKTITIPDWTSVSHPNAYVETLQERIWGFVPVINNVFVYYDGNPVLNSSIINRDDITNVKIITVEYTILGDHRFAGKYKADYQIINNNGNRTTKMISNQKLF